MSCDAREMVRDDDLISLCSKKQVAMDVLVIQWMWMWMLVAWWLNGSLQCSVNDFSQSISGSNGSL